MMHHLVPSAWVAIFLALWPMNSAESQSPGADATVSLPCVLLKNDNVLFGHAHQMGEFVVVRTGKGGEIQLPRSAVACWAASTRDLYRYRVDHRQKGSLAAHLRDAKWCLQYDLYDLAEQEIRAIRSLDPNNREAKSLDDQLQRQAARRAAPRHQNIASVPSSVQQARFEDADQGRDSAQASFDVTTLRAFASHVQPMLFNRCGRCHGESGAGDTRSSDQKWTLVMPPTGARASSRITRENLAASMEFIDPNSLAASKLLLKATTPHGGQDTAPLAARNSKAIESLQWWLTLANSRRLPTNQDPQAEAYQIPAVGDGDSVVHQPIVERSQENRPFIAERPVMVNEPAWPSGRPSDQPARLPRVANPFDPDLFNRRFDLDAIESELSVSRFVDSITGPTSDLNLLRSSYMTLLGRPRIWIRIPPADVGGIAS